MPECEDGIDIVEVLTEGTEVPPAGVEGTEVEVVVVEGTEVDFVVVEGVEAAVHDVEGFEVYVPGMQGPPGENSGAKLTRIAAVNLSGERVVTPRSDGTVEYADNTVLNHCIQPLWLTLGAALIGDEVTVVALGEVVEGGWTWTAGMPIFLGTAGNLTQTPPTSLAGAAFIEQVAGTTESPTKIFFDPQTPIVF